MSIRHFLKDEASVATATCTFFTIIFVRFKTYATSKTVKLKLQSMVVDAEKRADAASYVYSQCAILLYTILKPWFCCCCWFRYFLVAIFSLKSQTINSLTTCHSSLSNCYSKISNATFSWVFNPLHPKISMHILHTVLITFPKEKRRRICLLIKSFISWWSFSSFSWP